MWQLRCYVQKTVPSLIWCAALVSGSKNPRLLTRSPVKGSLCEECWWCPCLVLWRLQAQQNNNGNYIIFSFNCVNQIYPYLKLASAGVHVCRLVYWPLFRTALALEFPSLAALIRWAAVTGSDIFISIPSTFNRSSKRHETQKMDVCNYCWIMIFNIFWHVFSSWHDITLWYTLNHGCF